VSVLHRVLASLLCVLGVAAAALGIASATAWRADDVLVADAVAADGTTMIVTDPGVLDLAADQVTITATVPHGDVVIALGRSADVDAWVGDDAHTRVTGLATWHVLATDDVAAAEPSAGPTSEATSEATEGATAAAAPTAEPTGAPTDATTGDATGDADADASGTAANPAGSDLWAREAGGTGRTTMEWTREDGRWSVLVAATDAGVTPRVSLAWPQVVTTPWLVPGVVVGALLLVIGLTWWVMLLVAGHRRPARVQVAAPPVVVLDPAAPVTRRQLRELEEQRQRRATHGSPSPAPEPGSRAEGRRRGSHAQEAPTPQAPVAGPTPSVTAGTGHHRAESRTGEPRATRRFGRRRKDAPTPVPEVAAVPLPPVAEHRATPAASADAWRRAWGLGVTTPDPEADRTPSDDRRPEGGAR
jgi:hypothetical protein